MSTSKWRGLYHGRGHFASGEWGMSVIDATMGKPVVDRIEFIGFDLTRLPF